MIHSKQWVFLKGKFEAGQLGHAYLFSGIDIESQKEVAKKLIALINKNVPGSDLAIQKEQFPDLWVVKSINSKSSIDNEKDMMEIDIAQIRDANHFLSLHPYYGNHKTIIVENAERMNTEAQNSFLKTLEEPKGKTLIILISSKPDMLLATISSRCQAIKFFSSKEPNVKEAKNQVLQELLPVINGDLAVKFQYAKKANLEGDNFNKMLHILQRYFRNILLENIGVVEKSRVAEGKTFTIGQLKKIIRLIENLHKQVLIANVNQKLALEILLLEL